MPRGPELAGSVREAASQPIGSALTSLRYASINLEALRTITGKSGDFVVDSGLPLIGQTFNVVLPGAGRLTLVVDMLTEQFPGVTTYSGYLESDRGAQFVLSVENDTIVGSISLGQYRWVIEPTNTAEGLHTIKKIDLALMPRILDAIAGVPGGSKKAPQSKVNGSGTVRILFLAANDVPNPSQRASQIIATMTLALGSSKVKSSNRVVSAGMQIVPTNLAGFTRSNILYQIYYNSGPFQVLREHDMFFANADVAFLLVQEDPNVDGDYLTLGRVGGAAFNLDPEHPYGLSTDDYALGDLTAIHEIGHMFGGFHEDIIDAGIKRPKLQGDGDWVTLMGGYIDPICEFPILPATSTCERINYFSNPSVSYLAESTGAVGTAEMESHLEGSMPVVSGWRETGNSAAPPPPDPINATSEQCYGLNSVTWTAQVMTTDYELYRSTSSSFTNPVLIYAGRGTFTTVNVSSGTWYLRARACSSAGCSNYTSQVSATRISGCY